LNHGGVCSAMNWNKLWAKSEEMESVWKAIDKGKVETVRRLVAANPKLMRWERGDGKGPLDFYAVASKPSDEMLEFLLALETGDFAQKSNPVLQACRWAREDTLRALLKHGCNPNGREVWRFETPLHVAAGQGNTKFVQILLDAGADPGIEGYGRITPLEHAIKRRQPSCIELLRAHPAKKRTPFQNPRKPIEEFEIDLLPDEKAVRTLIKKGVTTAKSQAHIVEVTAVALHGSGYQGFVEVGMETGTFDPSKPDCGADVSLARLARREFPKWREPYAENNRVIVHYGGKKPANQTSRASCERMDEPFFRFFKTVLKRAIADGDFDKLPLAEKCLFGVQTYYFHHCEFWNKAGKRVT
jgi:hypothetical protein